MELVYLASENRTEGGKRTRARPGTVEPSFREQKERKNQRQTGLLNLASENRTRKVGKNQS
jgi:hypothetical protein